MHIVWAFGGGGAFQDRLQPWMAGAEPYRDVFTGVSWKAPPSRMHAPKSLFKKASRNRHRKLRSCRANASLGINPQRGHTPPPDCAPAKNSSRESPASPAASGHAPDPAYASSSPLPPLHPAAAIRKICLAGHHTNIAVIPLSPLRAQASFTRGTVVSVFSFAVGISVAASRTHRSRRRWAHQSQWRCPPYQRTSKPFLGTRQTTAGSSARLLAGPDNPGNPRAAGSRLGNLPGEQHQRLFLGMGGADLYHHLPAVGPLAMLPMVASVPSSMLVSE